MLIAWSILLLGNVGPLNNKEAAETRTAYCSRNSCAFRGISRIGEAIPDGNIYRPECIPLQTGSSVIHTESVQGILGVLLLGRRRSSFIKEASSRCAIHGGEIPE